MRSALGPGGRLVMMVWQAQERNEWAISIARALSGEAAEAGGSPAARQPFSLGDPRAVTHLLGSAGFLGTTLEEVHESVWYGPDAEAAFEFVCRFAVVQEAVARLDARRRERALERLRDVLASHRRADGVWFDSRAWIVTARRS